MTDDLEHFDGLESVTLTIGANEHEVQALRRPLVPRVDGGVQTDRAAWHVRAADLSDDAPAIGTTLTAGEETWTVTAVERLSFNTRYRLVCERSV